MTARTPTYLKARFENGDIPVGTDYEDVFDSFLNIAQATSTEQTLYGPLNVPQITAGSASCQYIRTNNLSVTTKCTVGAFECLGAASVSRMYIDVSFSSPVVFAAAVSATTVSADSSYYETVSTSALRSIVASANTSYITSANFIGALDVSAVGTTQAAALLINQPVSFVIFADGNNLAVKLPTSQRGLVQTVINAASTTLKIFPAVSARFLVTALNASLNIPADRVATIYHKGDDRYGIQIA